MEIEQDNLRTENCKAVARVMSFAQITCFRLVASTSTVAKLPLNVFTFTRIIDI